MPRLKSECPTKATPLSPRPQRPTDHCTTAVPAKGLEICLTAKHDDDRSPSVELGESVPSRAELRLRKFEKAYEESQFGLGDLDVEYSYRVLSTDLEEQDFGDDDIEEEEDLCNDIDEARQEKLALKRAIQKHCRDHNLQSTVLTDYERTYYVFEGTSSDHLNHLISEQINSLAQPEVVDVMNMVEKAYRSEGLQASGEEKQNSAALLHEIICGEINLVRASLFEKKFEDLLKTLPEEEEIPSAALRKCFRSTLEDCKARLERLKHGDDQDQKLAPGILIFERSLKTDTGEVLQTRRSFPTTGDFSRPDARDVVERHSADRGTVRSTTGQRPKSQSTKRGSKAPSGYYDEEQPKTSLPHEHAVSPQNHRARPSSRIADKPRWTTEHAETLRDAQCYIRVPVCELKGVRTAIKIKIPGAK